MCQIEMEKQFLFLQVQSEDFLEHKVNQINKTFLFLCQINNQITFEMFIFTSRLVLVLVLLVSPKENFLTKILIYFLRLKKSTLRCGFQSTSILGNSTVFFTFTKGNLAKLLSWISKIYKERVYFSFRLEEVLL